GLPRRGDGGGEGVHERVHVGGGQVVLFVPGGGGQHDVGEQRGAGHPEVQAQQQIQLAGRRLVAPHQFLRADTGVVGGLQVGVRAEQVPVEVLVALAGGAEQVGPPHRQT